MGHGSDLARGDRRRNERRRRLRQLIARDRAIVGIDLADRVQEVVVCDHDGVVLARRNVLVRAWELTPTLVWAADQARAAGFDQVVVACEPTGHRWRTVVEQCDVLDLDVVCVQPMLVHREREREDLTRDRSDARDATLIADLVAQLRCYEPERIDATWHRLRQLGARRRELVTRTGRCRQQLLDLLGCVWPAALETARQPLDSIAWRAAMTVVLDRAGDGDLAGLRRRMRWSRFAAATRAQLAADGGQRMSSWIVRHVYEALDDPTGMVPLRHGTLERTSMVLAEWQHLARVLDDVETRMVAVVDELELTELVTSIPGLSAVTAAAILAETGDLHRFATARSLVKHAGLCPRANSSGTFDGDTRISGRGRAHLRLAAWRAVWGALPHNPVLAARHHHLTSRTVNPLTPGQARAAIAASLLRQLHAVVTRRQAWDPAIAAGHRPHQEHHHAA